MSQRRVDFVIGVAGKGGVGKTALCAVLLDQLARQGFPGPVLAVDGDPATTLHLALGLPAPLSTLAQVRETIKLNARTIRSLPQGQTPTGYLHQQLEAAGVITQHHLHRMPLHLLPMGQGEGPGCYCAVNRALSQVLDELVRTYPLVVVDNEGGLEHLSRYRLKRLDLLLLVTTPTRAATLVAQRILATAQELDLSFAAGELLFNRVADPTQVDGLAVPESVNLAALEQQGRPLIDLHPDDPVRAALMPLVRLVRRCA